MEKSRQGGRVKEEKEAATAAAAAARKSKAQRETERMGSRQANQSEAEQSKEWTVTRLVIRASGGPVERTLEME